MKKFAGALFAAAALCAPMAVHGQAYPNKVVRIVVPYPPGGTVDAVARVIAQRLSESLGQQFIVDNRPGASGTIGSTAVAKSPADGYTLLVQASTFVASPLLMGNVPYDVEKDFTPDHEPGLGAVAGDGIPRHPGEEPEGVPRRHQGGSEEVRVRHVGGGLGEPSRGGGDQVRGEGGLHHHSVQGHFAGAHRRDGRSHQRDGRRAAIDDAAREKRQAEAAGGHHRETRAVAAGRADGGRVGPRRLRDGVVVRACGRRRTCRRSSSRSSSRKWRRR